MAPESGPLPVLAAPRSITCEKQSYRWYNGRARVSGRAARKTRLPRRSRVVFTLDDLARALRSMPRDAVIKIGCPDGSMADIAFVKPSYRAANGAETFSTADGARYTIVLIPEVR